MVAVSNGAVTVVRDQTPGASALDTLPDVSMPVVFAFRSAAAAEAVLAGARTRLAQKAQPSGDWYTNVSAGQVAAAVKAEATAFAYDFDIGHPGAGVAARPGHGWAWGIYIAAPCCIGLVLGLFVALIVTHWPPG